MVDGSSPSSFEVPEESKDIKENPEQQAEIREIADQTEKLDRAAENPEAKIESEGDYKTSEALETAFKESVPSVEQAAVLPVPIPSPGIEITAAAGEKGQVTITKAAEANEPAAIIDSNDGVSIIDSSDGASREAIIDSNDGASREAIIDSNDGTSTEVIIDSNDVTSTVGIIDSNDGISRDAIIDSNDGPGTTNHAEFVSQLTEQLPEGITAFTNTSAVDMVTLSEELSITEVIDQQEKLIEEKFPDLDQDQSNSMLALSMNSAVNLLDSAVVEIEHYLQVIQGQSAEVVNSINTIEQGQGDQNPDLVEGSSIVNDLGDGVTIDSLKSLLDDLKGKLDGMNEMSEMTSLRLQMTMDRRSKFISTLSNILKKISSTQDLLVQNLK